MIFLRDVKDYSDVYEVAINELLPYMEGLVHN